MRLHRLLIALSLLGPVMIAAPEAAAGVETGCVPTAAGYTCIYGPVIVPNGGTAEGADYAPAPPAGYVTSARATLVYGDGKAVPHHAVHLHHAAWVNLGQQDMTCAGWPERFFATGKERTRIAMPAGYGYHWAGGALWGLGYHLDSMHGRHRVYIKLNLGFVPEPDAAGLTPITPVWLDVDNCSDSEFDVPRNLDPGRHKEVWEFSMPQSGRFVALAGHLHDGGLKLELRNKTTGAAVFTSRAVYRYRWDLTAMTTYADAAGIPVSEADVLELTAVYNDTRAWPDVMGIMVGAFVPAS